MTATSSSVNHWPSRLATFFDFSTRAPVKGLAAISLFRSAQPKTLRAAGIHTDETVSALLASVPNPVIHAPA
jgi:hypothetical protein